MVECEKEKRMLQTRLTQVWRVRTESGRQGKERKKKTLQGQVGRRKQTHRHTQTQTQTQTHTNTQTHIDTKAAAIGAEGDQWRR